jgi:signal transduction histidine kinase
MSKSSVQQQSENYYRLFKEKPQQLEENLHELNCLPSQLAQTEKMSSLNQLLAGVAHEINNPINSIYGNLDFASEYIEDLLNLIDLYQRHYPNPAPAILNKCEAIDLEFLMADFPKLLSSMKVGIDRIREIVLSLRHFSRLDEAERKLVDIHEGIDSTLLILQSRIQARPERSGIEVIKEYGDLPPLECYPELLNQVFMNLLTNAVDSLEAYNHQRNSEEIQANPSRIWISTSVVDDCVIIRIADNGLGISEDVSSRIFDPFFTTKPIGVGTGLGLSISHQLVVERHRGILECHSAPGQGAEFVVKLPTRPPR